METGDKLAILRESVHAVNSALDESDIIDALLDQAVNTLGARAAMLRLLSADGNEFVQAAALGLSEAYLDKGPVRVDSSGMDRRVLDGETVLIADLAHDESVQYPAAAAAEGLRGLVATPIRVRDEVIGVLRVYVNDTSRLMPDDFLIIRALADLAALALEKARFYKSLYCIAEALSSSIELQPMLQQVLEAMVTEMWLKAASIRLLDPKREVLQLIAAYGLSEVYLGKGPVHVDRSSLDRRVIEGEIVTLHDVVNDAGFEYPAEAAREGIRSVLALPLRLKGQILGVMHVYSGRPQHFGPVFVNFLSSAADLVALAIENAELYGALQARYEDIKLDVAEWYRFLALG